MQLVSENDENHVKKFVDVAGRQAGRGVFYYYYCYNCHCYIGEEFW